MLRPGASRCANLAIDCPAQIDDAAGRKLVEREHHMAEFVHIQPTGRLPMVINLDHVVRIEEHQDHSIIVMSDKTVWTVQMSASAVPQLQRLPGSRGLS